VLFGQLLEPLSSSYTCLVGCQRTGQAVQDVLQKMGLEQRAGATVRVARWCSGVPGSWTARCRRIGDAAHFKRKTKPLLEQRRAWPTSASTAVV